MKNIAAALVKAKKAFAPALKDKTNPAFRSKYADLGACIEAVDDALLANGIALVQETSEDQTGVTVETVFLHETGEQLRCGKLHVPASKQDPQGYGSALTYARRYSLMAACGIAPEDDDGNAASKPRIGVMADVLSTMPQLDQEARNYLDNLARQIPGIIAEKGAGEVVARLEREDLDTDQKLYLWSLLGSKDRSAIKKAQGHTAEMA